MSETAEWLLSNRGKFVFSGFDADDFDQYSLISGGRESFQSNAHHGFRGKAVPEYIDVVGIKLDLRQAYAERRDQGAEVVEDKKKINSQYAVVGRMIFLIIGVGVLVYPFYPSWVTRLALPVGLTLWAVLAFWLRRSHNIKPHA